MLRKIDPLADLPEAVQSKLTEAGWRPGTQKTKRLWSQWRWIESNVAIDKRDWMPFVREFWDDCFASENGNLGFEMYAKALPAKRILEELYSLSVTSDCDMEYRRTVVFDVVEGLAAASDIRGLGKLLKRLIVPVGETRSQAHLLIEETGRVYLLGYVSYGVYYVGENFGLAMEALLSGGPLRPVYFDESVDRIYRLPGITADTPNGFCPLDEDQ